MVEILLYKIKIKKIFLPFFSDCELDKAQRYNETVCFRPATDFDLAMLTKLSWNIATKPRQPLCIAFEKQI